MLSQWRIRVHKNYPLAAPVMADDTTKYVEWGSSGAVTALLVEAQPMKNGKEVGKPIIGWVTCGSYLFPFQELKLTKDLSLVMARREPSATPHASISIRRRRRTSSPPSRSTSP